MREENIKKYAKLIVTKALNVQPDQPVHITAPIESNYFVRYLVDEIYKVSTGGIMIDWMDDYITRAKFVNEPINNFQTTPQYAVEKVKEVVDNNYARLYISATDPDSLVGIDPTKLLEDQKTKSRDLVKLVKATMSDHVSWSIVSIPTLKWAEKVFPESLAPMNDLWDAILTATRCDTPDPVATWDKHVTKLKGYAKSLNDHEFDKLVFKNKLGTNIEIGLPVGHIWMAAESQNQVRKNTFIANMPTEEVFTMPHREQLNGRVYASKPLKYQGALIDGFWLEFKNGKLVDFDAKVNKETLAELVNVDEGAKMAGEIALVSHNTPISLSNVLFYNTLFDENASCHIALGKAYPTCISDSEGKTVEELKLRGVNDSAIHVDFMFGTSDLSVIGIKDGIEVIIFDNGNFV